MNDKVKKIKLYRTLLFIKEDIEKYVYENMYSVINIKRITTDIFDICEKRNCLKPEIDFSHNDNFVIKLNFNNDFLIRFDINRNEIDIKK